MAEPLLAPVALPGDGSMEHAQKWGPSERLRLVLRKAGPK